MTSLDNSPAVETNLTEVWNFVSTRRFFTESHLSILNHIFLLKCILILDFPNYEIQSWDGIDPVINLNKNPEIRVSIAVKSIWQ